MLWDWTKNMTLRQQRFAEDVNSAIAVCEQYGWPFTGLSAFLEMYNKDSHQ